MTAWQIIRLIPLILKIVKMLQAMSERGKCNVNKFTIDEITVYILANTKFRDKLLKQCFSDYDLQTVVNFALLILKLTGKD